MISCFWKKNTDNSFQIHYGKPGLQEVATFARWELFSPQEDTCFCHNSFCIFFAYLAYLAYLWKFARWEPSSPQETCFCLNSFVHICENSTGHLFPPCLLFAYFLHILLLLGWPTKLTPWKHWLGRTSLIFSGRNISLRIIRSIYLLCDTRDF